MDPITLLALVLAGAIGQVVRAAIGLAKALQAGDEISGKRFTATLIVGAVIGGAAGVLVQDWRAAFLSGYAGTDFIEGAAHSIKRE